jgi:hypothetical protein
MENANCRERDIHKAPNELSLSDCDAAMEARDGKGTNLIPTYSNHFFIASFQFLGGERGGGTNHTSKQCNYSG